MTSTLLRSSLVLALSASVVNAEIKPGEWYSGKIVYKFSVDKSKPVAKK